MALQGMGKDLARRAKSKCEITGAAGVPLRPYEVPPVAAEPDIDRTLLISAECREMLEHPDRLAGRAMAVPGRGGLERNARRAGGRLEDAARARQTRGLGPRGA